MAHPGCRRPIPLCRDSIEQNPHLLTQSPWCHTVGDRRLPPKLGDCYCGRAQPILTYSLTASNSLFLTGVLRYSVTSQLCMWLLMVTPIAFIHMASNTPVTLGPPSKTQQVSSAPPSCLPWAEASAFSWSSVKNTITEWLGCEGWV